MFGNSCANVKELCILFSFGLARTVQMLRSYLFRSVSVWQKLCKCEGVMYFIQFWFGKNCANAKELFISFSFCLAKAVQM